MNKLTVVLSGRKQSGKSSTCNYIRARYLNKTTGGVPGVESKIVFGIDATGELVAKEYNSSYMTEEECKQGYRNLGFYELKNQIDGASVKVYSFADPLKDFCINVFGVPYECCWGTDAQKNMPIEHLLWENLPDELRPKEYDQGSETAGEDFVNPPKVKTGPMTGREIMQIFGTEICRKLYADCWARGTYSKIKSEGNQLALVTDARFPNEISMGNKVKAKTVRLTRKIAEDLHASETALDGFDGEYSLVIDNTNMTLEEQCKFIDPHIDRWFEEAGI